MTMTLTLGEERKGRWGGVGEKWEKESEDVPADTMRRNENPKGRAGGGRHSVLSSWNDNSGDVWMCVSIFNWFLKRREKTHGTRIKTWQLQLQLYANFMWGSWWQFDYTQCVTLYVEGHWTKGSQSCKEHLCLCVNVRVVMYRVITIYIFIGFFSILGLQLWILRSIE